MLAKVSLFTLTYSYRGGWEIPCLSVKWAISLEILPGRSTCTPSFSRFWNWLFRDYQWVPGEDSLITDSNISLRASLFLLLRYESLGWRSDSVLYSFWSGNCFVRGRFVKPVIKYRLVWWRDLLVCLCGCATAEFPHLLRIIFSYSKGECNGGYRYFSVRCRTPRSPAKVSIGVRVRDGFLRNVVAIVL